MPMTKKNWARLSDGLSVASIALTAAAGASTFTPLAELAPVLLAAADVAGAASLAIDCVQTNWGGSCQAQVLVFSVSQGFGGAVRSSLRPLLNSVDFAKAEGRVGAIFDLPQDITWMFTG